MHENMLEILDCPVCWRRSNPKTLIQCRNGCRPCFSQLRTSPICRVRLEPEIQTFSQEALNLISIELRHIESYCDPLCHEAVAKIFKCMECNITPTKGPVFQCEKGHVYCYRCPGLGRYCYPCKRMYSDYVYRRDFNIRSLAVSLLLCWNTKPCRFTKYGCLACIVGFSQHEDNCKFSENYCVVSLCFVRVSLLKLLIHILEDCQHASQILKANEPSKFNAKGLGGITIPIIPRENIPDIPSYNFCRVNILKLGEDKYFFIFMLPTRVCIRNFFYTFFLGVPEEAKNCHFL